MGIFSKIASFLKRTSKEGQHTIEYAVLMILVMAGVIVMGRYVIRSWNANLKGWEDSARDSFEDPLTELPPPPIPACTANDEVQLGCGAGALNTCTGNIESCAETEMTYLTTYTPTGCQCSARRCEPDPCCCTTPVAVACNDAMGSGAPPPPCTATGLSPTTASGCPNGFMGYSVQCGGSTYVGCRPDATCLIYCEIANLPCTTDGQTCSFPKTAGGSNGISSCPPGYYVDPGGPPTAPCDSSGNWGGVTNLCYQPCGDGTCDAGAGETCFTCPADCGAPIVYGGYSWCSGSPPPPGAPPVCGDGSCTGPEDCNVCAQDCPGTPFCFPNPFGGGQWCGCF